MIRLIRQFYLYWYYRGVDLISLTGRIDVYGRGVFLLSLYLILVIMTVIMRVGIPLHTGANRIFLITSIVLFILLNQLYFIWMKKKDEAIKLFGNETLKAKRKGRILYLVLWSILIVVIFT